MSISMAVDQDFDLELEENIINESILEKDQKKHLLEIQMKEKEHLEGQAKLDIRELKDR